MIHLPGAGFLVQNHQVGDIMELGEPFQKLILSAIALAIYSTPLPRFTNMFPRPTDSILPALAGVLNLTICWFEALRFRNGILETQTH